MKNLVATFFAGLVAVSYAQEEKAAEDKPAEEAKPTIVTQLTEDNFEETLKATSFLFVKFYAPWCTHCKQMAGDWEKLAEDYKADEKVSIGEVDATVQTKLGQKYGVQGYPTLKWFQHGEEGQLFNGKRDYESMKAFVIESMKPALKEAADVSELADQLAARAEVCPRVTEEGSSNTNVNCIDKAYIVVKGGDDTKKIAEAVANKLKPTLATTYYIKSDSESSITIHKGTEEVVTEDIKGMESDKVVEWAVKNRVPNFGQINEENFEIYLENAKNGMLWVCLDPKTLKEDLKTYSKQLAEVSSKYPFVWFDINDFEAHAKSELGCKEFPTVVLQKGDLLAETEDAKIEKFIKPFAGEGVTEKLSKATVEAFLTGVESGEIKPEPIPDELDQLDDEDEEESGDEEEDLDGPGPEGDEEL